jgi:hypothetical protein
MSRNFGGFECRRCWARDFCLAEIRDEDIHVIDVSGTSPPDDANQSKDSGGEEENGTPFES